MSRNTTQSEVSLTGRIKLVVEVTKCFHCLCPSLLNRVAHLSPDSQMESHTDQSWNQGSSILPPSVKVTPEYDPHWAP